MEKRTTVSANTQSSADGFLLMGAGEKFREDICDMIADTMLFASLPWNDVDALSRYVQCYEVKAGTTLFREGDAGSFLCLLVKGRVEIYKEADRGRQRRLVCITRGKTVGEMSLIDNEPRSATCIVKEESVVLVLSRQSYETIIKEHPHLALQIVSRIARQMSQRMRGLNGQLVEYLGQEQSSSECE